MSASVPRWLTRREAVACRMRLTRSRPRPRELTVRDEIIAMDNLDILKSNGFEVSVDEDKAPGRGERISLMAMPISQETTFDFKGKPSESRCAIY